jgi:CelD/BcsL family acetyltransferase involved in cellulose biosynthesis
MNLLSPTNQYVALLRSIVSEGYDKIHVEMVQTLDQLESHSVAWNRLTFESLNCLPMLSYAWIASYLEHQLESGEGWFCLFAYDNSELVGVLPVVFSTVSLLKVRRLKARTPHNNHTFSIDFLIKQGREKEIISLFLSCINRIRPAVLGLKLKHLPAFSPSLSVLAGGIKGVVSEVEFDGQGSFIKVEGTCQEFKERLSTRFNRNLRRLRRKLASLKDVNVSFLTEKYVTEGELIRFMQIEASGWKSRTGTAIIQSPSLVLFYRALVHRLTALGWLEWHFLDAEEKTIAGHLAIRVNRSLVIYKIGYDEAYSSYSPGQVLFERMVERAFTTGDVDEIDCLTDYPWNRNWQMEQRTYYNLSIFPFRLVPLLTGFVPLRVRAIARHVPGLRLLYGFFRNLIRRIQGKEILPKKVICFPDSSIETEGTTELQD